MTTDIWNPKAKPMTGNGEDWEVPPEGSLEAVLVGLIDVGTHDMTYMGEVKPPVRQILLAWELTDSPMSGYKDRNHVIMQKYSLTTTPRSNLRKMMEKWRGVPYKDDEAIEIKKALGKKCMLNVMHVLHEDGDKKGQPRYAKLDPLCASKPNPKLQVPDAKHTPFCWNIGDDPATLPDWLPYWMGKPVLDLINDSHEMKAAKRGQGGVPQGRPAPASAPQNQPHEDETPGDDIPF